MNTRTWNIALLAGALGAMLVSTAALPGGTSHAREKIYARYHEQKNSAPKQQPVREQPRSRQPAPSPSHGAAMHGAPPHATPPHTSPPHATPPHKARPPAVVHNNGNSRDRVARPPAASVPATRHSPVQAYVNQRSKGNLVNNRSLLGVNRSTHTVYRPPRVVTTLPTGYRHYSWNGSPYYHYSGLWYRPYGTRYVVVGAPYGMFVSSLPSYYNTFWFGGVHYYHSDSTYYVYEPARSGYVVTHSPYADEESENAGATANVEEDLYIYPAQGQSEQQQADDRYECHQWAAGESGFDPVSSDYDADRRADYQRAMTACLTGRGYSVR